MPTCPAGHDSASSDFCDVCGMRIGAPAETPAAVLPDLPAQPCPQCGTTRSGQFCEACGFDFDSGQATGRSESAPPVAGPGASGSGVASSGDAAAGSGDAAAGPGDAAAGPGDAAAGPGDAAAGQGDAAAGQGDAAAGPGDAVRGSSDGTLPRPGGPAAWTAVVAADRVYYDNVIAAGGPDAGTVQFPGYCPERLFRLTGPEMRIGRRSASRGIEPEIDLTGPPTDPGVSRLHAVLIADPDGSWAVVDPGSENGTFVNDNEIASGVRVPLRDGDRIHLGAWTVLTIQVV
jgi:hypothetical protein